MFGTQARSAAPALVATLKDKEPRVRTAAAVALKRVDPQAASVEVIVVLPEKPKPQYASALEFLESLPSGPRAFKTWEEYEQHLREEKDSWDR